MLKLSILTTDTAISLGHNLLPLARLSSSSVSIMYLSFATGTLSALALLVVATAVRPIHLHQLLFVVIAVEITFGVRKSSNQYLTL